jgi:glycine cleavage system H protein
MSAAAGGDEGTAVMEIRDDRRYTADHEWLLLDGGEATIGITDYAQDELGDVVYVAVPTIGARLTAKRPFGEVESVKTVSELFAPVSGEVIAVNEALMEHPEYVNSSPYDDGWMIRVHLDESSEVDGLLDAAGYRATLPPGS